MESTKMRNIYKIVFGLYLFALLWLLLFKFSSDIISVLANLHIRELNLIPFAGYSQSAREMIDNVIVFIPFGILLGVNVKSFTFWQKLSIIGAVSLSVEILQYIFAIGVTDITDLITNTAGGLMGLGIYALGSKYANNRIFDLCANIIIAALVLSIILLRVFVLRIKY